MKEEDISPNLKQTGTGTLHGVVLVAALFVSLSVEALASSPVSRCADCHFANPGSTSLWHLSDWENSAHGRKNVGCEGCHGGDPTTFDSFAAHKDMAKRAQFGSPVHRMNLPKTCGSCHPGPFQAFQQSKHYELLREGDRDVPTCTTCHGNAGSYLPSPKALASECSRCHGAGKIAPNTDRPAEGKLNLVRVREIRRSLDESQGQIRKLKAGAQRRALEAELSEARGSLRDAVQSAHMFVFDEMHARLSTAATRADLLREGSMALASKPTTPKK
ncbi:MAG: cytochrome c3 family protein [Vicinamibacteria bacterium]